MTVKSKPKPMRRAAADAVLGLSLFLAFAFGLLGSPSLTDFTSSQASAAEMARVAAFTGPLVHATAAETAAAKPAILVSARADLLSGPGRTTAVLLLAGVFTILFAFNLAFFRHLRQVYASPRRRASSNPGQWSGAGPRT